MNFKQALHDDRRNTYGILLGVCGIVVLYALVHDQLIVTIAPEHFTLYHESLWGIQQVRLLAAAYAFKATLVPGLVYGFTCVIVARFGPRKRISIKGVFRGVLLQLLIAEMFSLFSGWLVYQFAFLPYPVRLYPELSGPVAITQTIQVSCYLFNFLLSSLFLVSMVWLRCRGR